MFKIGYCHVTFNEGSKVKFSHIKRTWPMISYGYFEILKPVEPISFPALYDLEGGVQGQMRPHQTF